MQIIPHFLLFVVLLCSLIYIFRRVGQTHKIDMAIPKGVIKTFMWVSVTMLAIGDGSPIYGEPKDDGSGCLACSHYKLLMVFLLATVLWLQIRVSSSLK